MSQSIGFIGAGNMGEAIIGAALTAGCYRPADITASDVSPDRLAYMAATYGIRTTTDNRRLFCQSDIIVLAVKPQQMTDTVSSIAPETAAELTGKKLVISIAAGFRMEKIEALLYDRLPAEKRQMLPIIRVMPNTPALVLQGVSGMCANGFASGKDMADATRLLSAMGSVTSFAESDLDAVTALSGSGPAYVFYLAEAMIDAGEALGLERSAARQLAVGTIKGAAALMEAKEDPPEQLRRNVTSPGGTTEAALKVFAEHHLKQVIGAGIKAAADRSRELSR